MAADVEGNPSQHHHHPEAALCQHHHLFLPHRGHLPFPPLLHHHHHHHHHPLPRPFLCARCKCWNFPANSDFHAHPDHQHHPYLHEAHAHSHPLHPHAESAELMQDQELRDVDHQAEAVPSDRCGADEMAEIEEEEYEFVMTDEWMEFFAKSEARRQEKKRQQKKAARDLRKATRSRVQAEESLQLMGEEHAAS
ncbi:hypothetical protein L7F22_014935 [Adiantum nelumboides]|nr:hypothetical protein [Adiantum nelumboides]